MGTVEAESPQNVPFAPFKIGTEIGWHMSHSGIVPFPSSVEFTTRVSRLFASMKSVFLLWHTNVQPTDDEVGKLIGVYDTRDAAYRAKARAATMPGFDAYPDGFTIDEYIVGKDNWTDGFITVEHSSGD